MFTQEIVSKCNYRDKSQTNTKAIDLKDINDYDGFMKKRKLGQVHYIGIAIATVLFWRASWNILDRLLPLDSSYLTDILTGLLGLCMLWLLTRNFKHLD